MSALDSKNFMQELRAEREKEKHRKHRHNNNNNNKTHLSKSQQKALSKYIYDCCVVIRFNIEIYIVN